MKPKYLSAIIFLFSSIGAKAQGLSQTVRGTVVEMNSNIPVPEVEITCICSGFTQKTTSDSNGYFRLENIPVGRQSFLFIKKEFSDRAVNNMDVSAGKELVLNISMEEKIEKIKEANITVKKAPLEKPLNDLATVSSRQFNVEETQRYAAAVNDPARMAMGFAGVMAPDDGNNMIVIRGNAPNGLIWRMEGMDIPNPNHFSNVGTSGGGITILSAQLLANSDFFTGAFPAEYGNGLSGVFDLKLRKGNNEKREHTVQFGLLGLDLATEGPLGKKGGSYLVNYRYSTLSMISALGIELGSAVTKFQDLSYHVNLPLNKKTKLSFFGFSGLSDQIGMPVKDSAVWKTDPDRKYDWTFYAHSIFNGAKIQSQMSQKHSLEIKTGMGITQNGYDESEFNSEYQSQMNYREKYGMYRATISAQSNYKCNSKNLVRSGIIVNQLWFDFAKDARNKQGSLENLLSADGNTQTLQGYSQWQHKPTARWTINSGLHAIWLRLNNTYSIEPRIGLRYTLGRQSWLSAGAGVHSQMQPLGSYFYKNETSELVNRNLKLSKAVHYVIGYDKMLAKTWHFKTEAYMQQLKNLPVSPETGKSFCIVNSLDGFYSDTLVSRGKGMNYGMEFTLEKFFTGNTYLLTTASISNSKYTDNFGREFNTRFNVGRTVSVLAGKEWTIGKEGKNTHSVKRLGLNIKALWIGGMRDMPINLEASRLAGETVRDLNRTYEWQNPDYFRTDIKISYKINKGKHSSTWSLDIQNASNRKNVWGSYYNPTTEKIEYSTQSPLIPILAYKLEF